MRRHGKDITCMGKRTIKSVELMGMGKPINDIKFAINDIKFAIDDIKMI